MALPARLARRRRRGLLALTLVLVAAVVIGVGAWRVATGSTVLAPSLISMTQSEATAKAQESGLELAIADEGKFHETVPKGQILTTDPGPGERVTRNGTITAVLSLGPERFTVPDLTDVSRADAEDRLREFNLTVGSPREEFHDRVESGDVIRTEPPAGQELRRGAVVTLILSKGDQRTSIPDVVGKAFDDAADLLGLLGFNVSRSDEFDDDVPAGDVISQRPGADRRAARGEEIALVVSSGPEVNDVTVPRVIGMDVEEARDLLRGLDLEVEVNEFGGRFGGGRVISQRPEAGSVVEPGDTVTITAF